MLGVFGTLVAVSGTTANAADWPDRTVTIVVPYPAGGAADTSGRVIAHAMQPHLNQTVLVENRPGAAGNVGMGYVARSKPDGYTLGLGAVGTQTINQFLYNNMAYDAETDFIPIALVTTTPNVLSVAADSPWKDLNDIIKAAKKAKEDGDQVLTYASPGVGTSVHLTSEYFQELAGIKLLHIPFKGTANSLPAVSSGEVDLLFDNLAGSLSQIKAGKLIRGIAQSGGKRNPEAADLPTFNESGGVNLDIMSWFALYAPKDTPQPIIDKLIDAASKALKDPEVVKRIHVMAAEPGTLFGSDLRAFEEKQRTTWGTLIKEQNITIE